MRGESHTLPTWFQICGRVTWLHTYADNYDDKNNEQEDHECIVIVVAVAISCMLLF